MNLQDEVYVFEGTILQVIDRQYAAGSPDEDGGGSAGVVDIGSLVGSKNAVTKYGKGTPKYSKLYSIKFSMKDEQGREHICAFPCDYIHQALRIEVDEGDQVAIICSKKTDYTLRLINRTTGKSWAIAYGGDMILESEVGKKLSFGFVAMMAYIKALLHSVPIINIFSTLVSWIWLKKQNMPPPARLTQLLVASTCLYLFSYFIIVGAVQHTFQEPTTTKIVKTSQFKLITLPLVMFTSGDRSLFSDEESNRAFTEFYHSDSYDPNNVGTYLFNAAFIWILLVSLMGAMIQGTFVNLLRRDQMRKQMALDDLSKAILEG